MTELLKIAIVSMCINSNTTIQKHECVSVMGNCVANYNNEKEAFEKCKTKWTKVKDEIK